MRILDQLKSAILEKLAADPVSELSEGRFYWNTVSKRLRAYDGTTWSDIGASGVGIVPLGALIPVANNVTGSYTLPATGVVSAEGWQRADGAVIPGGNSLSGNTPNISNSRFIMGSTTSGTSAGAASVNLALANLPDHNHTVPSHTHSITSTTVPSSTHTHDEGTFVAQISISGAVVQERRIATASYTVSHSMTGAGSGGGTASDTVGAGVNGTSATPSATTTTANVTGGVTAFSTTSTGMTGTSFSILPTYITAVYLIRVN